MILKRHFLQASKDDVSIKPEEDGDKTTTYSLSPVDDSCMTSSLHRRSAAVSALSLAVKCAHLDVVDSMISLMPNSELDQAGCRTGQSALDQAVVSWFRACTNYESLRGRRKEKVCPSAEGRHRHDIAARYRILRRLLETGANRMSASVINGLMTSSADAADCHYAIDRLVKVFTLPSAV